MIPFFDRYSYDTKDINDVFSEESYLELIYSLEHAYFCCAIDVVFGKDSKQSAVAKYKPVFSKILIKQIEAETKHDVVAVVEALKRGYVAKFGDRQEFELIHVGLTSQDMVSLAYSMMAKKQMLDVEEDVKKILKEYEGVFGGKKLIGYTHGQKAVEIDGSNLVDVLKYGLETETDVKVKTRFGNGACGGGFPIKKKMSQNFHDSVLNEFFKLIGKKYGLEMERIPSRQTDYYPTVIESLERMERVFSIVHREAVNMWLYCHNETLKQKNISGQVGSSAMPQKINPISFENCEGNSYMAKEFATMIKKKLLESRLDRDLSDITVVRNIGLVFGYAKMSILSFTRGLKLVSVDEEKIGVEIENSYEMKGEEVLTLLKMRGYKGARGVCTEMFKTLRKADKKQYTKAIQEIALKLNVDDDTMVELINL